MGVADGRVFALETAADIDPAAALAAHGFKLGIVDQADLFAGDLDLTAGFAGIQTGNVQGAAVVNDPFFAAV